MTGQEVFRSRTETISSAIHIPSAIRPSMIWTREGFGTAAWGEAATFDPGVGPDRFERAWEWFSTIVAGADIEDAADVPGSGPIAFASFTFDPMSPGSKIVVPEVIVGWTDSGGWKTSNGYGEHRAIVLEDLFGIDDPAGAGDVKTSYDQPTEMFLGSVSSAREAISQEGLEKVVLARTISMRSDNPFNLTRIVAHLADRYPGCFTFLNGGFIGATPELLVRKLGDWIDSIPLAGSSRRGANAAEDDALGAALMASTKDRWEHQLAVSSVVEKLVPLCEELAVEDQPFLYLLPNVQHLGTKIQGRLTRPLSAIQAAGALHPTAAVCGVPQEEALEMIRRLEPQDREIYCGPVGWVDRHGDGEMAIALRCAKVVGDSATIYAGAGIVADSDPYAELAETELKARAMLEALTS